MNDKLTVANILKLISQESIMARYFPHFVNVGRKYANPFRADSTAGCYFAYSSRGTFTFFDNALPEYGGDCFKIAMLANGLNFRDCLEKINTDFNLNLASVSDYYLTPLRVDESITKPKELRPMISRKSHFKIQARNWERVDFNYWSKYGISLKLLNKYDVFPIQSYSVRYWNSSTFKPAYDYLVDNDICYCYKFQHESISVKLYRPTTKELKDKWKSNVKDEVQGLSQLPDYTLCKNKILIITSSMKDLLVLVANGYNAIAPQTESMGIPDEAMADLKTKFTRIIYCFDADTTGINMSLKYAAKHNCEALMLNDLIKLLPVDTVKLKDFADIMAYLIQTSETVTDARSVFKSSLNQLLNERDTNESVS